MCLLELLARWYIRSVDLTRQYNAIKNKAKIYKESNGNFEIIIVPFKDVFLILIFPVTSQALKHFVFGPNNGFFYIRL